MEIPGLWFGLHSFFIVCASFFLPCLSWCKGLPCLVYWSKAQCLSNPSVSESISKRLILFGLLSLLPFWPDFLVSLSVHGLRCNCLEIQCAKTLIRKERNEVASTFRTDCSAFLWGLNYFSIPYLRKECCKAP